MSGRARSRREAWEERTSWARKSMARWVQDPGVTRQVLVALRVLGPVVEENTMLSGHLCGEWV
jgi:hypothetical protein